MMVISVRPFASLASYIPGGKAGTQFEVVVSDGAVVADLARQLGLPEVEVRILFVNGRVASFATALESGDVVGLFPALGGG